ncbi:alpha/beta hydrolase family protein [Streptomyces umbrinus]|uniref:alpha/beta hydrolase family protein n=1 Tax=Streptomyces umbrinus TaxID=67370 RepID=UPI00343B86D8
MTSVDSTTQQIAAGIANAFAHSVRAPIMRRPDEYGMVYEDVHFAAEDGTALEGWFIPADSDRLVIANHPGPGNRYGFPGHVEPYNAMVDFEVNFLPDYRNLHDAGYNVLAYDLRNHGESESANNGVMSFGLHEYRDVIGSLRYGRRRLGIDNSRIAFLSRCLGANSTIIAMSKHPEEFEGIRALVAVQPSSFRPVAQALLTAQGVPDVIDTLDLEFKKLSGFDLDELSPVNYAKDVTVPTLVAQVQHDSSTHPSDVQGIYDNLGAADKKLHWIEGTTRRFDGYNHFPKNPELMLEWFSGHFA